jgi:hypothetical protein
MHIQIKDQLWTLTLDTALQTRGVKLPALLTETPEEETIERAALLRQMDGVIKMAYERYLNDRRSDWKPLLDAMVRWAGL